MDTGASVRNSDIRESVLNGRQTAPIAVGDNIYPIMTNGNKSAQAPGRTRQPGRPFHLGHAGRLPSEHQSQWAPRDDGADSASGQQVGHVGVRICGGTHLDQRFQQQLLPADHERRPSVLRRLPGALHHWQQERRRCHVGQQRRVPATAGGMRMKMRNLRSQFRRDRRDKHQCQAKRTPERSPAFPY